MLGVLVLLSVTIVSSLDIETSNWCLVNEPKPEYKLFNHNGSPEIIQILGSHGVASRLLGSIFSIFAHEILGYEVDLTEVDETLESLDPQTQFAKLSSCQQQYCTDLDTRLATPGHLRVPQAMLSLDIWLPAAQEVTAWGLIDAGQLGPATRFGWFIPSHGPSALARTHWKLFASPQLVKPYILTQNQQRYIEDRLQRSPGSYFCPPSLCREGQFIPPICSNESCATLLTDFPDRKSVV